MKQANRKQTQARTDRFRKLEGKHRELEPYHATAPGLMTSELKIKLLSGFRHFERTQAELFAGFPNKMLLPLDFGFIMCRHR